MPFSLAVFAIGPWRLLDSSLPGAGRARDALVLAAEILGAISTYAAVCHWLRPSGWPELMERLQAMLPRRFRIGARDG